MPLKCYLQHIHRGISKVPNKLNLNNIPKYSFYTFSNTFHLCKSAVAMVATSFPSCSRINPTEVWTSIFDDKTRYLTAKVQPSNKYKVTVMSVWILLQVLYIFIPPLWCWKIHKLFEMSCTYVLHSFSSTDEFLINYGSHDQQKLYISIFFKAEICNFFWLKIRKLLSK